MNREEAIKVIGRSKNKLFGNKDLNLVSDEDLIEVAEALLNTGKVKGKTSIRSATKSKSVPSDKELEKRKLAFRNKVMREGWNKASRRESEFTLRQLNSFADDIVKVYKKHGLALVPEYIECMFTIDKFSESDEEVIKQAVASSINFRDEVKWAREYLGDKFGHFTNDSIKIREMSDEQVVYFAKGCLEIFRDAASVGVTMNRSSK